jgi:hypothetical protein
MQRTLHQQLAAALHANAHGVSPTPAAPRPVRVTEARVPVAPVHAGAAVEPPMPASVPTMAVTSSQGESETDPVAAQSALAPTREVPAEGVELREISVAMSQGDDAFEDQFELPCVICGVSGMHDCKPG